MKLHLVYFFMHEFGSDMAVKSNAMPAELKKLVIEISPKKCMITETSSHVWHNAQTPISH
jgi:hypothetical protein